TIFFSALTLLLWVPACFSGKPPVPLPLPAAATLALLYLSIAGTLLAFALFFYLLKRVRLSSAMTLAFITPVVALLVDALFEKQTVLSPESYIGICVVLSGGAISVLSKVQSEKATGDLNH